MVVRKTQISEIKKLMTTTTDTTDGDPRTGKRTRPLEQGFIDNRLHGTDDLSEFIHVRYGSLVKFLQNGTKLVMPRPFRVSPPDPMSLDSDSDVLMFLSLSRWGFPCPVKYLQIYHTYKGQGVPFPPDFRTHSLYFCRSTWGKVLCHDCDRRDRLCVSSDVLGSDQFRRPFVRISDNVTIEDFHYQREI